MTCLEEETLRFDANSLSVHEAHDTLHAVIIRKLCIAREVGDECMRDVRVRKFLPQPSVWDEVGIPWAYHLKRFEREDTLLNPILFDDFGHVLIFRDAIAVLTT